ncbi:MAG: dihydroneopterin aldolase [Prevotellaceae bacterium]|jgi:dihydroneopterin aldolase|nr:dihydroneopterin aldolase [Prevotellaceae bacterium]
MGTIELHGMEFFAYHGCLPEEQIVGNYFYVDILIDADLTKAAETDCLDDTVNYQDVYDIVKREMAIPSRLLEHVAGRIVNALQTGIFGIKQVSVRIAKMNPPLGGKIESSVIHIIK